MALDDWLAAVGGGLHGYEESRRYRDTQNLSQEKLDMTQKVAEMRAILSGLQITAANDRADRAEAGRNTRNTENNTTRTNIAGQASTDRRYGIDTTATTQRRGQDLGDEHFWDASARWWEGDSTSRRGQDIGATTTRRGQDMSADTADENRHSLDAARGEQYALNAYKAEIDRRRNAPLLGGLPPPLPTYNEWLQTSEDPEIFDSVRRAHTNPTRQITPAGADRGTPPPSAAPDVAPAPPAHVSSAAPLAGRPAPPVPPRQGAAPAPSPMERRAHELMDKIKAADAKGQDSTALRAQLARLRAQAVKSLSR